MGQLYMSGMRQTCKKERRIQCRSGLVPPGYFLRYVDNHNDKELIFREKADEMLPVDMYIGGVEHAVLHLLYSRFYTKFLCDIGAIDFDEPFQEAV